MVEFRKTILPNGTSVVTERHPNSRAASCGIFVCTGSRDEERRIGGISHLIEHMVFKGTKKRTALQLAKSLEMVGGELNAYTSREYTCYHTLSLNEHLALGFDVLFDLVLQAQFPIKELQREKQVVIQEILMSQDNTEEYIFDVFAQQVFGKHPIGCPILGTEDSVEAFSRQNLLSRYKSYYSGKNLILSASGNIDHDEVVEIAKKNLSRRKSLGEVRRRRKPTFHFDKKHIERDAEQVHMLLGLPTSSFKDDDRFEAFILNAMLGGGMTSKLYQSVREKKGLAYSIYSHLTTNTDSGVCTVYAGTEAKNLNKILGTIRRVFQQIKENPVRKSDLELFKTQVKGSILLGADDVDNRMNSLAVNEMVFGEYKSVDLIISEIEKVSIKSLTEYIRRTLNFDKTALLTMGNIDSNKIDY